MRWQENRKASEVPTRWWPGAWLFRSGPTDESQALPVISDPLGNPTIAWQPGEVLMADRNRAVIVKRIRQLVGLPPDRFDALYGDVINKYAGYVQRLPAIEHGHQAHLGSLLDRALHLAERALCLRRGRLLPPNRPPEFVARQADRWTYAVFLAALFQNIGRPAVELKVSLFRADGRELGVWTPAAGPMEGIGRYHFVVQRGRHGDDHGRFAPFLARLLLSKEVLQWLAADLDLMTNWLATLAGDHDHAGMLGSLVVEAGCRSGMAEDAAVPSSPKAAASHNHRSLRDILLAALRQLFESGLTQTNQRGAEAWVTNTDVWLVSDIGIKLIREGMIGDGIVSVPGANNGILDTLQQQDICVPNPKGRAIWSVKVGFGKLEQVLTMLRFRIETIWPDPDRRPPAYQGELVADWHRGGTARQKDNTGVERHPPDIDQKPPDPPALETGKPDPPDKLCWKDVAAEFFAWLAEGIQNGSQHINDRNGGLWVVEEGLFLRTPGTYKRFGDARGYHQVDVQKAVISQEALLMNTRPKPTPLIHYRETRADRKDLKVRGHVILDPNDLLGITLPDIDRRIVREAGPDGRF